MKDIDLAKAIRDVLRPPPFTASAPPDMAMYPGTSVRERLKFIKTFYPGAYRVFGRAVILAAATRCEPDRKVPGKSRRKSTPGVSRWTLAAVNADVYREPWPVPNEATRALLGEPPRAYLDELRARLSADVRNGARPRPRRSVTAAVGAVTAGGRK
ncbi:MAG: hypothetical protein ACRD0P_36560, partial [Stackebrandtia sp.]